ncbi:stage II sporulation protein D [Caldibacillus lycopersici]|uniref:Stage II sporulation protein D n=1 Tax=Perspicuibacillus lycopersici TaxID=1325689 RepID=A0AAE3IRS9_9BACI|nr:stage II sporulation protein D [Perspicuibacillus lycopersici]MCU9613291.1 stage II sporulation protein D [Perspicuibacillus lycopersici]
MIKVKPIVIVFILLFVAILTIPSVLVLPFSHEKASGKIAEAEPKQDWEALLKEASPVDVSVYRSANDKVETVPLEEYIVGVVASEMPAEFEEEALKAQSLAARTFIVRQLMADQKPALLKGADVGDNQGYQVYTNDKELREKWGANYNKYIEKIRKSVYETRGQIVVYDNQPITASYFSTSNGYTENSEAYWTNPFPYLKSVESPWDTESKEFTAETVIPVAQFEEKLGVTVSSSEIGEIESRTPGKRVEKVKIGDKELTGREIRDKLSLRSADFSWVREGDDIVITTKGYGHGVGMSQYGANGMAKEGKTYEDIIKYYYQGVAISKADHLLEQYVVKK